MCLYLYTQSGVGSSRQCPRERDGGESNSFRIKREPEQLKRKKEDGLSLETLPEPPSPPFPPSSRLALLLANLPAPGPENLDDLWRYRRRQGHSEDDQALMDGVREGQLRDETCFNHHRAVSISEARTHPLLSLVSTPRTGWGVRCLY